MMLKNRFSLFVATFLIVIMCIIALPEKGYSGFPPSPTGGCCMDGDGECVGCEGFFCATSNTFCVTNDGLNYAAGLVCADFGGGPICAVPAGTPQGCCLVQEGICNPDQTRLECFGEGNDAERWFDGKSCSEIPQCAPLPRNVPTLSEWGLIAMAGILGIVGFMVIRRRKAIV